MSPQLRNDRGFALLLAVLLTVIVSALALFAVAVLGNATIINLHSEQQAQMEAAAYSGAELGRAVVNRNPELYPDDGFVRLPASELPLEDAEGRPLTGYRREVYAGPTGVATGQFGVFGSVVSVVNDARGPRSVVRREMAQESFAKYAYFTDQELLPDGREILFARGDQIFGPVHSNDFLRIQTGSGTGPIFHGDVSTARSVVNRSAAHFRQDLQEGASRIELPDLAELSRLKMHAEEGNTAFTSSSVGAPGTATMRIEFIGIDIDGDGEINDENEGFFKVYRSHHSTNAGANWVTAAPITNPTSSPNCGHRHEHGGRQYFYTAAQHDGHSLDYQGNVIRHATPHAVLLGSVGSERGRCYLGGSDSLSVDLSFQPSDARGAWQPWSGSWATPMPPAIASRADRDYLIPLGRAYNPNFKGVIHVTGKVAISGVLRGRVTLATTGDIVIADDIVYATDPSAATCADILGLFAGGDIVVSENLLNSPVNVHGGVWRTLTATEDEVIHGVLLTLGSFYAANYDSGARNIERCEGANAGRGCLYVTGGIIQRRRGPVGMSSGTGYLKRYSYDQCAATAPPPYYPTTGHFAPGRIFEVDPTGFEIGSFFSQITAD